MKNDKGGVLNLNKKGGFRPRGGRTFYDCGSERRREGYFDKGNLTYSIGLGRVLL